MKSYYVYIIQCADNSYYTGITNNLQRRMAEHDSGLDPYCYTYKRRPLKLVFQQQFTEVTRAIAFEKRIKGWSRKKKEAIINNEWYKLPGLAKNSRQSDK